MQLIFNFISHVKSISKQLSDAKNQAYEILIKEYGNPRIYSFKTLFEFFTNIPTVVKVIINNPITLFFVIAQFAVICLAYLIWMHILYWVPDQTWSFIEKTAKETRDIYFYLFNLALLCWSILVILIAWYSTCLCNTAMIVSYNLNVSRKKTTIINCLMIAYHHIAKILAFSIVDSWHTLNTILDKLPLLPQEPSKSILSAFCSKLADYSWKLSTTTVVQSLINGKEYIDAGKDSIALFTSKPNCIIGLRLGYNFLCWVLGITSYICFIIYFIKFGSDDHNGRYIISNIYYLIIAPFFMSVGIVLTFLGPFYSIIVSKLYSDMIDTASK